MDSEFTTLGVGSSRGNYTTRGMDTQIGLQLALFCKTEESLVAVWTNVSVFGIRALLSAVICRAIMAQFQK
jgi:hypothetical protein